MLQGAELLRELAVVGQLQGQERGGGFSKGAIGCGRRWWGCLLGLVGAGFWGYLF